MEVLINSFATAARRAGYLAIAGHGSVVTPAQLIVAARVASVMLVVALVRRARAFVFVVFARLVGLITRVHPAFLVGVLGLLGMPVARLGIRVITHGWALLVAGTILAAPVAVAALVVLALTISIVASHAVQPVGLTMVRKMMKLASRVLLKFLAHLTLCVGMDLVKLVALVAAIIKLSIVDCLKVPCESL